MTEYLYFVKPVGMPGPVKIGITERMGARFREHMAWSAFPLEVLVSCEGSRVLEQQVHKYFERFRSHGEWFHVNPDLLDLISKISAGELIADALVLPAPRLVASNPNVQAAIEMLGSEAKLAAAAGVSQVAINKAKNADRVSAEMAVRLETATGGKFSRGSFRPDLWPYEGQAA